MASFNKNWAGPFRFVAGRDDLSIVNNWGCVGKAGIYIIRDQYDIDTLYVGKAEATSCDIHRRLKAHLAGTQSAGNRGIADLAKHQQIFTIHWAASNNPTLSESIAIIQLNPLFNKQSQWRGIDKATELEIVAEAKRLGLIRSYSPSNLSNDPNILAKIVGRELHQHYHVKYEKINLDSAIKDNTLEEKIKAFEKQNPSLMLGNIKSTIPSLSADVSKPNLTPDL